MKNKRRKNKERRKKNCDRKKKNGRSTKRSRKRRRRSRIRRKHPPTTFISSLCLSARRPLAPARLVACGLPKDLRWSHVRLISGPALLRPSVSVIQLRLRRR